MKKVLLLIGILFIALASKSQITLENTYNTGNNPRLNLVHLSLSGYKYAFFDNTSNTVKIYNLDHTLWKTVTLVVPGNSQIFDVYIAEELFDTDANVEVAFVALAGNNYTTVVRSELGVNVFFAAGRQKLRIVNTTTDGWKMLLAHFVNGAWDEEVYDLPGTGVPMRINSPVEITNSVASLYPNPVTDELNLYYQLPLGYSNYKVKVISMTGQEVFTDSLDSEMNQRSIHVSDFAKGKYICVIEGDGMVLYQTSFIK